MAAKRRFEEMTALVSPKASDAQFKAEMAALWASGKYERFAESVQPVADALIRLAKVRPGEKVLDLACGTGNSAFVARSYGASVTGLDLTPELIEIAKIRAGELGFSDITWVVGDAENLTFPDKSFDVVVSSCGIITCPDPHKVAREMARVLKPGGRIAIQGWSPNSGMERMLHAREGREQPPPSTSLRTGVFSWGQKESAKQYFEEFYKDIQYINDECTHHFPTPEDATFFYSSWFPPVMLAFANLPNDEMREALRNTIRNFFTQYVTPMDGKVRFGREYLITIGTRKE